MPNKEADEENKGVDTRLYCVQIHALGTSSLPATIIRTKVDKDESVGCLTDRLVQPYINAIVQHHYVVSHSLSCSGIIIDFGNGRTTIPCLCSPSSDDDSVIMTRVYVRLFMTLGEFEYMLTPGENVANILKLHNDDEDKIIKLRVELPQGDQELLTTPCAFEGIPELDAAGNIFFSSLINPSDDYLCEAEIPLKKKLEVQLATIKTTNSTAKKINKRRVVKDPASPKKNVSAYIHFMKSVREGIKSKNPNLCFADIGTMVGRLYRELAEGDRRRWDEVAQVDKKRYEEENAKYCKLKTCSQNIIEPMNVSDALKHGQQSSNQKGKEETSNVCGDDNRRIEQMQENDEKEIAAPPPPPPIKKRKRQSNKQQASKEEPKKNVTAYIHYAKHLRDEVKTKNPNLDFAGIGIEIGKMYREQSEEERRHWEQVSLLDKERYIREKNDYTQLLHARKSKAEENNNITSSASSSAITVCDRIGSSILNTAAPTKSTMSWALVATQNHEPPGIEILAE